MNRIEIDHVRTRIASIRDRLLDITNLLQTVAKAARARDRASYDSMMLAVHSIQAVRDDLESVCDAPPGASSNSSPRQAEVTTAQSELDSDEFDDQA